MLLLQRFVNRDLSFSGRKSAVRLQLERSRSRIVEWGWEFPGKSSRA